MQTRTSSDSTIKVRFDAVTNDLLDRAREYVQLDKSKFIRQSVREKAEAVISEHDKTKFSTQDWHNFFEQMDNPPEPTERMKKAALMHRKIIES